MKLTFNRKVDAQHVDKAMNYRCNSDLMNAIIYLHVIEIN